jgi:hypothetical protein
MAVPNIPSFRSYEHQLEIAKASGGFIPHPAIQDLHGGIGFEYYSPPRPEETATRVVGSLRDELRMWTLILAIIGGIVGSYSLLAYVGNTINQAGISYARAKKAENMVPETPEQRLKRHSDFLKTDPFAQKK